MIIIFLHTVISYQVIVIINKVISYHLIVTKLSNKVISYHLIVIINKQFYGFKYLFQ